MNEEMINRVRQELNQRLKALDQSPVRDSEMNGLSRDQRDGPLAKLARDVITIDGLTDVLLQSRRDFGSSAPDKVARTAEMLPTKRIGSAPNRPHAVSEFVAKLAESREEVVSFRRDVLGDTLLKSNAISDWINKHVSSDGEPTKTALIVLRDEFSFDLGEDGIVIDRPIDVHRNPIQSIASYGFLHYAVPPDMWVHKVPVRAGGVLDRLRIVTERLADDYRWQSAQAAMFVLTGMTPLISSLSGGYEPGSETVLDRIRLVVDPELPPRQVEKAYRTLSRRIPRSAAPLSEKRLRLAAFMRSRPAGETYKQAMRAWNHANPDAKYDAETNFGRDAKEAQAAVRPRTLAEKLRGTYSFLKPDAESSSEDL